MTASMICWRRSRSSEAVLPPPPPEPPDEDDDEDADEAAEEAQDEDDAPREACEPREPRRAPKATSGTLRFLRSPRSTSGHTLLSHRRRDSEGEVSGEAESPPRPLSPTLRSRNSSREGAAAESCARRESREAQASMGAADPK